MGADFLLFSLPYAELDETRQQRLHEAIDQLTKDQLQIVAEAVSLVDQDDLPAVNAAIHAAVGEYAQLDARRDTTSCRYPTDPYWRIYTGGLSWGDLPTECCQTFDIMIACDPLFELIEGWAREDAVKLDLRDGTPETRPSADIAGIMGCLCQALTDTAHSVAGCVIQSSDNDHHDGEIFIQNAGRSGWDGFVLCSDPASVVLESVLLALVDRPFRAWVRTAHFSPGKTFHVTYPNATFYRKTLCPVTFFPTLTVRCFAGSASSFSGWPIEPAAAGGSS